MKTIIAGSRSITDENAVIQAIVACGWQITEVLSGGARGVDRIGEKWARMMEISVRKFIPNWDLYGKIAGFLRNEDMAEVADALVLVWDGKSNGSRHMLRIATSRKLLIHQEIVQ